MTPPPLKLGINQRKQRWHVDITWPDGVRTRHLLPARADEDAAPALAEFRRVVLPPLIAVREQQAREAAVLAAEATKQAQAGTTLRSLADWFLNVHLAYNNRADKTVDHYRRTINSFLEYASSRHVSRVPQLSGRIVQEWQLQLNQDKGREVASRDQVRCLRYWLQQCEEAGELRDLPAIKWVIPPKTKSKRFRALPRTTIQPWLDGLTAWRPQAGLIAAWVDTTGWRISDAQDFRVGELDRDRLEIDRRQLKTDADLPWPVTPEMLDLYDRALAGRETAATDHVFLDHRGQPWDYQRLVKVIDSFEAKPARWAGEHITFRDLRKSFGSRLAMAGCPPNVLKELLGHRDIGLTLRYYVHVDRDRMREWALGNTLR